MKHKQKNMKAEAWLITRYISYYIVSQRSA
jgi:hypothetical protein